MQPAIQDNRIETDPATWRPSLGAWTEGDGTRFRVWAPEADAVELILEGPGAAGQVVPLEKAVDGTFGDLVAGVGAGERYRYRIDGRGPFPDPASRYQPEGVHGPSEVVDPGRFAWSDGDWRGIAPEEAVLYEVHVGTFGPEGTFAGVTARLAELKDLGVTAVELMPVADFAGARSWGYDGVDLFAPAHSYGTPDDLRRLVDVAHRLGMAVVLDVVYNHLGPAGNYTGEFSPHYLSKRHQNPWGSCVNLDDEGAEMVREFFIENALHWVHDYHIDGLRLDATHALIDASPRHFLVELAARVRASAPDRRLLLYAEDHRNLDTMVRPEWAGGWDLDGVWADDFHHQMRRLLAGDNEGYYRDFTGTIPDLVETVNQGWFFTGQPSIHLDEPRGTDPVGVEPRRFVLCLQNHNQVGNRAFGERLHHQIEPSAYRAASALLLCAPQTPLLFMGQEWASSAPFLYFTDHEEDLGVLVTEGRRREFRHFLAFVDPEARERIPDPQAATTFEAGRLDWSERDREPHASTLRLYRALLGLRQAEPALRSGRAGDFEAIGLGEDTILLRREAEGGPSFWLVARLRGAGPVELSIPDRESEQDLTVVLTTEDSPYAPDPRPPAFALSGTTPVIDFAGPAAVLLRVESGPRPDR